MVQKKRQFISPKGHAIFLFPWDFCLLFFASQKTTTHYTRARRAPHHHLQQLTNKTMDCASSFVDMNDDEDEEVVFGKIISSIWEWWKQFAYRLKIGEDVNLFGQAPSLFGGLPVGIKLILISSVLIIVNFLPATAVVTPTATTAATRRISSISATATASTRV